MSNTGTEIPHNIVRYVVEVLGMVFIKNFVLHKNIFFYGEKAAPPRPPYPYDARYRPGFATRFCRNALCGSVLFLILGGGFLGLLSVPKNFFYHKKRIVTARHLADVIYFVYPKVNPQQDLIAKACLIAFVQ